MRNNLKARYYGEDILVEGQRRHSRWYERLIFSAGFQLIIGLVCVVILPSFIIWPEGVKNILNLQPVQLHTMIANGVAYWVAFLLYKKLQKFPGAQTLIYLLPSVTICWAIAVGVILLFRLDYSRPALLSAFVIANALLILGNQLSRKYHQLKLAIVPFGDYQEVVVLKSSDNRILQDPTFSGVRYDAVVADLRSDMPDEWQAFLANCALANIPVYHSRLMVEQLTGRVKVKHLSENIFGALYTTSFYGIVKRLCEIVFVLLLSPIWLPVMLIFGAIVKLESKGPMFFVQERVGLGDKDFKVYKLRSMCQDSEKKGAQFATQSDVRVTKVGKFIRKTRIDEIPQFINILKGDMSLIGPRPEQRVFVEQFKKEIPFYSYRHVVRPGISGWAQVTQGYAASAAETSVKLEYDLYYIKHFSFWLDVLIVLKTIRTMLTGFGAR